MSAVPARPGSVGSPRRNETVDQERWIRSGLSIEAMAERARQEATGPGWTDELVGERR